MPKWQWGSLRLSFSAAVGGIEGKQDLYLNLESPSI